VPDVPISFFFDDMPDNITANFGGMPGHRDQRDSSADDTLSRREALELIRAYYRIPDPAMRRRVRDLITSMGMGFFVSVAPTPSFNARLERGWVA
jgi:hypothetical protein